MLFISDRGLCSRFAIGETGNDVEHFISTRVSVVFVLVGECKLPTLFDVLTDDDDNVPLRRAGRILLNVLVTVR